MVCCKQWLCYALSELGWWCLRPASLWSPGRVELSSCGSRSLAADWCFVTCPKHFSGAGLWWRLSGGQTEDTVLTHRVGVGGWSHQLPQTTSSISLHWEKERSKFWLSCLQIITRVYWLLLFLTISEIVKILLRLGFFFYNESCLFWKAQSWLFSWAGSCEANGLFYRFTKLANIGVFSCLRLCSKVWKNVSSKALGVSGCFKCCFKSRKVRLFFFF